MKYRILFANYEYPPLGGGGSTASQHLAHELAFRGNRVEVVTAGFRGLQRVERHGHLRVRRVPALRSRMGQSNPFEMMSYVLSAAPSLLLRGSRRPDAVVSFHSIPSGLAAFPFCAIRGIPHIILFQGGDIPGWLPGELEFYHKLTLWLNRWIVHRSAAALANSDGLAELAQKSFTKKKIGVLYGGANLDLFRPPEDRRRGRTGPVRLFFVGRLTTQKGVDVLLDALARPELRDLSWRLDLAGMGPLQKDFEAQAARLGLADQVRFMGWRDRDEVNRLYKESDVLVFPSRYEGMSNVVLEALASGLPILGTRIAGTEQIVEDGENGYLVEVDDREALADRIRRVVEDRDLRLRLGDEARARAEKDWAWPARAKELEELISRVVEKAREKP